MNSAPAKTNRLPSIALGFIALLLVASRLAGLTQRVGISDRAALVALLVIGMALCALAMKLEIYGWKNPFNLAGSAIGALMLLLIAAALLNIPIPFITGDRDAFIALSILMAVKILIDLMRGIVMRPWLAQRKSTLG
jgi:hypothetical protein